MMLLTAIGWGMTPIGSESLITDSALYVVLLKKAVTGQITAINPLVEILQPPKLHSSL